MSSSLAPLGDRFFVVGTGCTELEQLYHLLVTQLGNDWQGLNEKHVRAVVDCAIRGKTSIDAVFAIYDAHHSHFVDKSHPNIWLAEKLMERYPSAVFVAMRPRDQEIGHVLRLMLRSTSCKKWCQHFGNLPFPNKFLGARSKNEYQALDIKAKCKSRLLSHIEEIDRLAKKYPKQFIALTPFSNGWKDRVAEIVGKKPVSVQSSKEPVRSKLRNGMKRSVEKPTVAPPAPPRQARSRSKTPDKRTRSRSNTPKKKPVADPNRHIILPHMPPTEKSTSLSKDIAFYWINLDRAESRAKQMKIQLDERKLRHYRIAAIDGRNQPLTDYIPSGWHQAKVNQHKYELATTLSHLKAIHRFVRSGDDIGIICEDDTIFEFEQRWPDSLQNIIDKAPKAWEVLQLSLTLPNPREWNKLKSRGHRYQRRLPHYFSALTYAIRRPYALSLLKKFSVPADSDEFRARLKGNVTRLQSELNLLGTGAHRLTVYPALFTYPTGNTSFIHPAHLKAHEYSKKLSAKQYA
jgi:GR25 family glycosyltransferase involved in LPS biosynthesis